MAHLVRTIAMLNQKGGVGKTTSTVNLGAAIAEAGRRVCMIDLDPQAHLTLHLGIERDRREGGRTTCELNFIGVRRTFRQSVHGAYGFAL